MTCVSAPLPEWLRCVFRHIGILKFEILRSFNSCHIRALSLTKFMIRLCGRIPAETLFCVLAAFLSGLWTGRMLTCGVWKLTFWALARTGVCVSKWAVFNERLFFLWILEAMLVSADFGAGVVPGKVQLHRDYQIQNNDIIVALQSTQ